MGHHGPGESLSQEGKVIARRHSLTSGQRRVGEQLRTRRERNAGSLHHGAMARHTRFRVDPPDQSCFSHRDSTTHLPFPNEQMEFLREAYIQHAPGAPGRVAPRCQFNRGAANNRGRRASSRLQRDFHSRPCAGPAHQDSVGHRSCAELSNSRRDGSGSDACEDHEGQKSQHDGKSLLPSGRWWGRHHRTVHVVHSNAGRMGTGPSQVTRACTPREPTGSRVAESTTIPVPVSGCHPPRPLRYRNAPSEKR